MYRIKAYSKSASSLLEGFKYRASHIIPILEGCFSPLSFLSFSKLTTFWAWLRYVSPGLAGIGLYCCKLKNDLSGSGTCNRLSNAFMYALNSFDSQATLISTGLEYSARYGIDLRGKCGWSLHGGDPAGRA